MASRFSHRSTDVEIMDDLYCSGEVVDQTLRELEFINRALGGNRVTLEGLAQLLKGNSSKEYIAIADLGCGGGDMLMRIADWGRRKKIKFKLTGIDANPNIIAYAKGNSQDYPTIQYTTLNIFSPEFQGKKFDIILATLFTHHFSDDELEEILKSLQGQAQIGVVVNDIHRHWLAYFSIRLLTRFFSKSAMVKFDAPLSVLRAFKRPELEGVLRRAGIENYSLRWSWAFRWRLIITCSPIH
jgi:2-polyprenyl-3-methyl-5-hydroxy-6-metoxy-1,4-benzoquinol methylase